VLTANAEQGLRVATGHGVIEILDLQREGARVLPAPAYLAGHPMATGQGYRLRP
jgi:methionyl-tRNA formyltransferase